MPFPQHISPRLRSSVVTAALALSLCATGLSASRFDTQILDDPNGRPIQGVELTLDRTPPDGSPEHTVESGTFGFAALTDITAGTYELKAARNGYVTHSETITFDGSERKNGVIRLDPLDVDVSFDIHFQVNGLATHAPLAGAQVKVDYWLPDGNLSGAADQSHNLIADFKGAVMLSGARDGFYTFQVMKTGWVSLDYTPPAGQGFIVSDGKVRLNRTHIATILMKPVRQSLTVKITGFDPMANMPGPLKGMTLRLTGIDSDGETLYPTVSAVSREDGTFTFIDLPPVDYRLEVGRLGYDPAELIIVPDANATYPNMEEVAVDIRPTRIKASLASIYQSTKPLEGAEIQLQGILDSNSEGIDRTLPAMADTNFTASAIFENLLPGRYRLYVKHEATVSDLPNDSGLNGFFGPVLGPSSFSVSFFPRETYTETASGVEEFVEMVLDPIPAVVTGRLMATDEQAELDEDPFYSEHRRVFHRIAHNGIEFVEWEPTGLLTNRTAAVIDTDASGYFTAMVIPGIHGVKIPTMTDYTGHNIEFGDLTGGSSPFNGPWPYADNWPHGPIEQGHHGPGLSFSSDHKYQLNLFVHAHHVHVYGQVRVTEGPFGNLILFIGPEGEVYSTPYNHLRDVNAMIELSGPVSAMAPPREDGYYLFKNLTPGSYTITLDHPDYTVTPVSLTIAPWQAPGIMPETAPFTPTYFFPGIAHDTGVNGFLQIDWKTKGDIVVRHSTYDADLDEYRDGGDSAPDYFSMASLPGRLFSYNGTPGFTDGIPAGNYTIWENLGGWFTASGSGSQTFDAVDGGILDNTPAAPTPTSGRIYQLDLRAVSSSDRTVAVPDVQVDFGDGVVATANTLLTMHTASPSPQSVTHTGGMWQQSFQFFRTIEVIDPAIPLVRTTIFMDRLMNVTGMVQSQGLPLSGATVSIRNRFGVQVASGMTDAQGSYNIGNVLAQNVYVEVGFRGFIQQRKRYNLTNPDAPDITADFNLLPIPPPTVSNFTLNRFGAFLPGVSKAGNATGFDANAARKKLTATWKVQATASTFNLALDGFEQADGSLASSDPAPITDQIAEIWVIDRRAFKEPYVNATDPTNFVTLTPPSPLNLQTVEAFLAPIKKGEKNGEPHLVYHKCYGAEADGPDYEGKIPLWELPPGEFKPMLLVITAAGGVAIVDYQLPPGDMPTLQGINLPRWAATILEVVGVGAAAGSFTQETFKAHGDGFMKVKEFQPNLEARIGLLPPDNEPEQDSALSYKYVLGVNMDLGEDAGSLGWLSFGPTYKGFQISGVNAEFEVAGADKAATLAIVVGDSKDLNPDEEDDLRDENYKPKAVKDSMSKSKTVLDASLKVGGFVELDADRLGNNRFSKLGYVVEAQGIADSFHRWDATPALLANPTVGPVLGAINKSGILKLAILGRLEYTIGGKLTFNTSTVYPQPGTGMTQTDESPQVWDLLGNSTNTLDFTLILRVAMGMELEVKGAGFGEANGVGLLQLGAPTGASDVDGVFIAFNLKGEGPLVKSITGAASLVLRYKVKILTTVWAKSFQWDGVRIHHEFPKPKPAGAGTQGIQADTTSTGPSFDLTPMNETFTRIQASTSPSSRFVGSGGMVVEDFYEAGSYGLSGDGGLFVYTGTDPATGEMTIMASLGSGESWAAPAELARAGGIGSLATTQLADGRRLIVWSEIAAEDVDNPFPSTTLRYLVSSPDGSSWSAPADIGAIAQASFDLRLVAMGLEAALTFRCTAEGPFGENCSLHSAIWNGSAWGVLTELLPDQPLDGHDLASNGTDKALAVAATVDEKLLSLSYADGAWHAEEEAATGVKTPLSAAHDGAGGIASLWQDAAGDLNLSVHDLSTGTWTHRGPVVANVFASDARILPLQSGGLTVFLLAWLEGSDTTRLWHAFVAEDGTTLMPRRELGITDTGLHSNLRLAPGTGHQATIYTHFLADSSSLRSYPVGLPSTGDCNGNGIDDAVEISGGLAADLNNNGVPDACEIADGLSMDRDRNGVPDELEDAPAGDLNRNGFPDMNEIFLGLLSDGNANFLPDEYEIFRRTLLRDHAKPSQFFRAPKVIIRAIRANDFDLDVQGTKLEKSDKVTGPWILVE